jgi:flagellar protein FliO/FliZ
LHAIRSLALIVLPIALLIAAAAAQAASSDLTVLQAGAAAHAVTAASAVPASLTPATNGPATSGPGAAIAFAAPTHSATLPSAAGGLVRVALALIVVLGAIFGAGWLSRRVHGTARGAHHPGLEVLAQLPLGPRERAVLIRVGAQQLLVGVCGGCVRTLHVCTPDGVVAGTAATGPAAAAGAGADLAAATAEAGAPLRPTFKSLLLKSLGK